MHILSALRPLYGALFFSLVCLPAGAARKGSPNNIEGKKVTSVRIRDLDNRPLQLPGLGSKNLLIFYVDPDHQKQNSRFIDSLERNPIPERNILAYGVVNMKDAPLFPNAMIRSAVAKRTAKNGATVYLDPDHSLRDGWGMGDIRNKFVVIFVNRDGVVEFFRWGEFTDRDKADFHRVVDRYR